MNKLALRLAKIKPLPPKVWLIVACSAVIILVAVWLASAGNAVGGKTTSVNIKEGTRRVDIAKQLKQSGLIRSEAHFVVISYLTHKPIIAGIILINPNQSDWQILDVLANAQHREQKVTIPEGWRREQIADYLASKGVNKTDFLTLTQNDEGKLFPDTYYIPLKPTAQEVATLMLDDYHKRMTSLNLTDSQLILASIVEREAKTSSDRAIIAQIYTNRLDQKMDLQADPTVQYARDTELYNAGTLSQWWQPITVANYTNIVSSYNTYLNAGLPPTPICDPGEKSIDAVLHPTPTTALYFFSTPSGQLITSQTLAEHNANKAKYLK